MLFCFANAHSGIVFHWFLESRRKKGVGRTRDIWTAWLPHTLDQGGWSTQVCALEPATLQCRCSTLISPVISTSQGWESFKICLSPVKIQLSCQHFKNIYYKKLYSKGIRKTKSKKSQTECIPCICLLHVPLHLLSKFQYSFNSYIFSIGITILHFSFTISLVHIHVAKKVLK